MRIDIAYEACWQNSFLTGDDDKPLDKNNERKFKATSKSKIVDKRNITSNTIFGLLCRLIGDQRKLHQARQAADYYFKNIESFIDFKHRKCIEYTETAYIVNKSESRPPQSGFIGVLSDDTPLFFSEYSLNLWSVLELDFNSLLDFIISPEKSQQALGHASPKKILSRLDSISSMEPYLTLSLRVEKLNIDLLKESEKINVKKEQGGKITDKELKKLEMLKSKIESLKNSEVKLMDEKILRSIGVLKQRFKEKPYMNEGRVYPMSLYAASLYLMLDMLEGDGISIEEFLNRNRNIQGFNPYGFNGVRDFLNPLTGGRKRCGGTPTKLTKSSGILEITLNIPDEKAEQLKEMIEAAGVSSFYLGKKGLAYVIDIR